MTAVLQGHNSSSRINYIDIYGTENEQIFSLGETSKEERRRLSGMSTSGGSTKSPSDDDGTTKPSMKNKTNSGNESMITARTEESSYTTPSSSLRDSKQSVPPFEVTNQVRDIVTKVSASNMNASNNKSQQGRSGSFLRPRYLSLAISNAISSNVSVSSQSSSAIKYNNTMSDVYKYARDGNASAILQLLNAGIKVNSQDPYNQGYTPLLYACENGHYVIVRLLLDKNANINLASNTGRNAMIVAMYNHSQNTDLLNLLIERNADVYAIDNISGE